MGIWLYRPEQKNIAPKHLDSAIGAFKDDLSIKTAVMAEEMMRAIEWASPPAEGIREHERDTRVAVMERCAFALSQMIGEHIVAVHEGVALVLNVSSGGMLLLMSHAPEFGQYLTIGMPGGIATDDGVRLADVRWTRAVAHSGRRMKYLTGVRFLEPQNPDGDEARLPAKRGRT